MSFDLFHFMTQWLTIHNTLNMAYLADLFLLEGLGMNFWDWPTKIVVWQIGEIVYMTFKTHFFAVLYNSLMASCKQLAKGCNWLEWVKIKIRTSIRPSSFHKENMKWACTGFYEHMYIEKDDVSHFLIRKGGVQEMFTKINECILAWKAWGWRHCSMYPHN